MKNSWFLMIVIGLCFISGCATRGEKLIINSYTDKEKSVLLSDKGIQLYNGMMERDDLRLVPKILTFLQESLQLNPKNEAALDCLKKTEKFGNATLVKNIRVVKKNLSKKRGRREEDDLNLCLALQKAYQIDPQNSDVNRLREQTKVTREALAEKIIAEGDARFERMQSITNKVVQGKEIVLMLKKNDKGILVGSSQEKVFAVKKLELENMLSGDMDFIILEAQKRMEMNKYHDAEIRFKLLNQFNCWVNNKYDDALIELQHNFYFSWAKQLRGLNQMGPASEKNELALHFKKTAQAQDLQTEFQNMKNKAEIATSFESRISEIDILIKQDEIAVAYQKINSVKGLTKSAGELKELEKRKTEVMALINVVYSEATADFVNENYLSAVKGFQSILAISRNYKDAKSYLKKAKSELKILALY